MDPAQYDECKHQAAEALKLIDPKRPYGTELFDALCRLTITPALEIVCLRRRGETIEVLLTQRSPTDTAYPNEWHCPGSAKRVGESDEDVFARLVKGEFMADITSRRRLDIFDNFAEARGHFLSIVYLCEAAEGTRGQWFDVTKLPIKTVDHHINIIIPMAVKAFNG